MDTKRKHSTMKGVKTMKYIIIDDTGNDVFTDEYETADKAITEARNQWDYLTAKEREKRAAFFVLESINPDETAADHFDGTPVYTIK